MKNIKDVKNIKNIFEYIIDKKIDKQKLFTKKKLTENQINEIKNYPLFKDLKLTDKLIENNASKFWKVYQENRKCEESFELDKCIYPNGLHYSIEISGENINWVHFFCPKLSNIHEQRRYLNNYIIRMYDDNFLDIFQTRKDIDISGVYKDTRTHLLNVLARIVNGSNNKGIYLYGANGVGKTRILIATSNSLAKRDKKICYIYVPKLIQILLDNKFSLVKEISENLTNCDVLIFDDFGAESMNNREWFYNNFLLVILDARLSKNKTTIFSSNYDIDSLYKKLTDKKYKYHLTEIDAKRIINRISDLSSEVIKLNEPAWKNSE